jgi:hypothetical protein
MPAPPWIHRKPSPPLPDLPWRRIATGWHRTYRGHHLHLIRDAESGEWATVVSHDGCVVHCSAGFPSAKGAAAAAEGWAVGQAQAHDGQLRGAEEPRPVRPRVAVKNRHLTTRYLVRRLGCQRPETPG